MFLMLFTANEVANSLNVVICFSISGVARPLYVQTTLTTGMSTLGKMSVGVCRRDITPKTMISRAAMMKV